MPSKWSDFEKYLRGDHLAGKAVTVVIARVVIEETHPNPGTVSNVPVLYFEKAKKGLVLSPTNQRTLARLFGDSMEGCIGKAVTLCAKSMRVAGRELLPIRISAAQPGAGAGEIVEPEKEEAEAG